MITEPAKSIASHCVDKSDDEQTHVASVSKAKGFKIMSLNIYTLLKHLDELRILVDQEIPHVIGINETKIDSSISGTDIQIEGYRVVLGTEINGVVVLHSLFMNEYQITVFDLI